MTTRAELRESLRNLLSDRTQWRDTLINGWINDAIRDYSLSLPRLATSTISMVTGTTSYTISSYSIQTMRAVEYPSGQTPRRLLTRLSRDRDAFSGGPFYDIRSDNSILYIGESPETGESLIIEYDTLHTVPASDAATLTIPDRHLELLRLYVIWKATTQLEMDENVSIDRKRDMMNSLGLNAFRAERAYRNRMRDVLLSIACGEFGGPWQMDKNDRIY